MKKTVFSKRKYIELEGISNYIKNQDFVNACDGLTGREILNLGLKVHTQYMEDVEISDLTGEVIRTKSVAEEMFKSLGYERNADNGYIVYIRDYMAITFNLNRKTINTDIDITVDEFRAIAQQVKELGWL